LKVAAASFAFASSVSYVAFFYYSTAVRSSKTDNNYPLILAKSLTVY